MYRVAYLLWTKTFPGEKNSWEVYQLPQQETSYCESQKAWDIPGASNRTRELATCS